MAYKASKWEENFKNAWSAYPTAGTNLEYISNDGFAVHGGMRAGTPTYNFGINSPKYSESGIFGNDTNWDSVFRTQQDCYNGGSGPGYYNISNTFICVKAGTYTFRSYHSGNRIWKNGTVVQSNVNAFLDPRSFSCAAGDRINADYPIATRSAQHDLGMVYMGYAGYAFAHRRDRNGGATLNMIIPDGVANIKVLYTLSTGQQTSLSQQSAITVNSSPWQRRTVSLSNTRNYFIISDRPIACYINLTSGAGTNDSLPLFPMSTDPIYGQFSNNGHILTTTNYYTHKNGNSVSNQTYQYRTDGASYAEINTTVNSNSVYTDSAATSSGGTFFTGAGAKVLGEGNNLIAAESQGDGNGSEMTPFVNAKAMGEAGMIMSGTDWVYFISDEPVQIDYFDDQHNLLTTFTLAGNSTYDVYDYRWTSVPAGAHFITNPNHRGKGKFYMYYDSATSLDDERVVIMADDWSVPN